MPAECDGSTQNFEFCRVGPIPTVGTMKSYEHIVSLGKNCQVGDYLLSRGLGEWGGIFNNLGTPDLPHLLKLLNEPSEWDLFSKLHYKGINGLGMHFFVDEVYRVYSIHEILGTEVFDQAIVPFRAQKIREEVKFKRKLTAQGSVLFIRVNLPREDLDNTLQLLYTLRKLRGDLDFDLYVFQGVEKMKEDWGIPNLHTFCDPAWEWIPAVKKWNGDRDLWDRIFKDVELCSQRNTS